ncbi:hypothetical protein FDECE_18129 [Fusarium decemcellulare]|nr:hypothetical protein FDECE_18129 [Fusarium decemcellulare]
MTVSRPPKRSEETRSTYSDATRIDEDWTKIPDAVERRRMQNRISAREYRERLRNGSKDHRDSSGPSDRVTIRKKRRKTASRAPKSSQPSAKASEPAVHQSRATPPANCTSNSFPPGQHTSSVSPTLHNSPSAYSGGLAVRDAPATSYQVTDPSKGVGVGSTIADDESECSTCQEYKAILYRWDQFNVSECYYGGWELMYGEAIGFFDFP